MSEQVTTSPGLPELADETIDAMEDRVFARIAEQRQDRTSSAARSRRRRSTVLWSSAAAAVALVSAVTVGPSLLLAGAGSASDAGAVPDRAQAPNAATTDGGAESASSDGALTMDTQSDSATGAASTVIEPQIMTTVYTSVVVTSIDEASDALTTFATEKGGYVASLTVGSGSSYERGDALTLTPDHGSVVLRLPSEDIAAAVSELEALGTVTQTTIDRQDVTSAVVDTTAQVEAYRVSVERLQALMAESGSVGDLVAAEQALTERQALLDSYEQQLATLQDQVSMSTVSIDLSTQPSVAAEPTGFLDGLFAGWNGLVATVNGAIVALGFLVPWLVVVGIAGAVVWLIVRTVRRRRRATRLAEAEDFS